MFLEGAVRRVIAPRKALWERNALSPHKSPHDRGHEELGVYYESTCLGINFLSSLELFLNRAGVLVGAPGLFQHLNRRCRFPEIHSVAINASICS